ncbi:MAG: hypothetical protein E7533_01330 [Ruminococcaceae bacterium]|nr:hypothetical protein [Oscillospiraceae bacterium]
MDRKYIIICFSIILLSLIFTLIVAGFRQDGDNISSDKVPVSGVTGEVTLTAQEGSYSLNVTTVFDALPDTDASEYPEAKRVAVVVYEYTNADISHGLSIGKTHFKAYDSKGNELEQFPQKGMFEPGEIETSATLTASVAFALNDETNYIKIEFYNDVSSSVPDVVFEKTW